MSKHDTIKGNLIALTRSRSFKNAVDGWSVRRFVKLSKGRQQACELCGTRFREGAVVEHRRSKATVVIGGTCLSTLGAHRFPKRFRFAAAKRFTSSALRAHYGTLVDPGNWLLWIRENAPDRLVQATADLHIFGALADSKQLQELIRFHDNKRLFPRNALLADPVTLEKVLDIEIASYITIGQARRLVEKGESAPSAVQVELAAASYMKKDVVPRVRDDVELASLWRDLGPLERRAVAALAALDARATEDAAPLIPQRVADTWPLPGDAPMFVWHPKVGLGFVAQDDLFAPKANVWLWRSERYSKSIYILDYWRGVAGCSIAVVSRLEEFAFLSRCGLLATRASSSLMARTSTKTRISAKKGR